MNAENLESVNDEKNPFENKHSHVKLQLKMNQVSKQDKLLMKAFASMAIISFVIGIFYSLLVVLEKGGFINFGFLLSYQFLTSHATMAFFYWLYFMQMTFLILLVLCYVNKVNELHWRRVFWAGFIFMSLGFILNQVSVWMGAAVLYDAQLPLASQFEASGYFYLGYIFLGLGLICVALSTIVNAFKPKLKGLVKSWDAISFATVIWAGLIIVGAIATLNVFSRAAIWMFTGIQPVGFNYTNAYAIFFHNMHYLPLMATVLIWYILAEATTGVKSIFSERASKIVFSFYLIFVPPTSLYHMFLEPNISSQVKAIGSVLSIFITVPTILVFILIVISLEASARSAGATGLFGWIKILPWKNPVFAALGMATVSAALGGVLANILIQETFAVMLSDTFFVPAYFHLFTVGTVSLTFLALLMYLVPLLSGRELWRPEFLAKLPYFLVIGVFTFSISGIIAGFLGAPRRSINPNYGANTPSLWPILMMFVGIGGIIMVIVLFLYVYGLVMTAFRGEIAYEREIENLPRVNWKPAIPGSIEAYFGSIAIGIFLLATMGLTAYTFIRLGGLPI